MIGKLGSRIKWDLCKEAISGRGGFSLFSDFWSRLRLSERLARHLPASGSNRGFRPGVFVKSIFGILMAGGEHLSDIRHLGSDRVFADLWGSGCFPASNTLTSWLNSSERRVDYENGWRLENVVFRGLEEVNRQLVGMLCGTLGKRRLLLDVDATAIASDKRTARMTYKGFRGYQPQLGYLSEVGTFVASEFRAGNEPSSKDVIGFLDQCRANMPVGTSIGLVRGDAAYYQREVLKWCKDNRSDFAIRAIREPELMRILYEIPQGSWEPFVDSEGIEHRDAQVAESWHSMEKVGYFRLAVLRRRREDPQTDLFDGRYEYFPVATSLECSAPDVIRLYNDRGKVEDAIGQLKSEFGLSSLPCTQIEANRTWVALCVLCFTLFVLFKVLVLGGEWAVMKAKAIRFHILDVGCRLVRHARFTVLRLACSESHFRFLCGARARALSLAFPDIA